MQYQQTIKHPVSINGIGLHSGVDVSLTINPADENTGIVFQRVDLAGKPTIPALYSNVVDTKNCTCLGSKEAVVSTIEHIMSALYIVGVDNAIIELDNQELPIMDGSARAFYDALKSVDLITQSAPRKFLKVLKTVEFHDDKGNFCSLSPSTKNSLKIDFEIDFPSPIVGYQHFSNEVDKKTYEEEIAHSRTFCEKYQVDYLKSIGLIKGGSLDNAVVLDGDSVLNPDGFRNEKECINHKVLDAIGDLYSSGYNIIGELKASKTGHYHTNELLKKLFTQQDNYEII